MRTAVGHEAFPESALEMVARGFAAAVPAIVIAYSVIIDPLINLQPVAQRDFSGAVPADLSKSTLVAQLLVPTLFVMLGFLAVSVR